MSYYAGIGARTTPDHILDVMTELAHYFHDQGRILRSGGAKGADSAFERGAGDKKEIFYAHDATPSARTIASMHHPAWHHCRTSYVQNLHGRNVLILLGKDLNTPVDEVYCWTPGGAVQGGTGLGIRVAVAYDITVYNLGYDKCLDQVKEMLNAYKRRNRQED